MMSGKQGGKCLLGRHQLRLTCVTPARSPQAVYACTPKEGAPKGHGRSSLSRPRLSVVSRRLGKVEAEWETLCFLLT